MPRVRLPDRRSIDSSAPLLEPLGGENHGVELEYETFGDPKDPCLLLIHGLNAQLIHWPEDLFLPLVQSGYYVVRFDNRDVGLSTIVSNVRFDTIPIRALKKGFNAVFWPIVMLVAAALAAAEAAAPGAASIDALFAHSLAFQVYVGVACAALVILVLQATVWSTAFRFDVTPPYTLSDMAQDAVDLMSALRIDSAHVCGASMGMTN